MAKTRISIVLLMTALMPAPFALGAENVSPKFPSLSVDAATYSQYVWRGLLLTDGPVFQPSATVLYRGLSFNVWSNMDLTDVNQHSAIFNELDYTVGYERATGPLTLSGGIVRYTFPNTEFLSTSEVYVGAALDTLLAPSVTAYYDFDEIDGSYVTFDAGYSVPLPSLGHAIAWQMDFTGGVGWGSAGCNRGYFGVNKSGFADFHPVVSLPLVVNRRFLITPSIAYSTLAGSRLRKTTTAHAHNFFWGVTVSLTQ